MWLASGRGKHSPDQRQINRNHCHGRTDSLSGAEKPSAHYSAPQRATHTIVRARNVPIVHPMHLQPNPLKPAICTVSAPHKCTRHPQQKPNNPSEYAPRSFSDIATGHKPFTAAAVYTCSEMHLVSASFLLSVFNDSYAYVYPHKEGHASASEYLQHSVPQWQTHM